MGRGVSPLPDPDELLESLRDLVRTSLGAMRSSVVWCARAPAVPPQVLAAAERRGWLGRDDLAAMASRRNVEASARVGTRRLLRRIVAAEVIRTSPQHVRVDVRCPRCGDATHGPSSVRTDGAGRLSMSTSSAAESLAIAIAPGSLGVDIVRKGDLDGLDARSMMRHVPAAGIVQRSYPTTIGAPELWTAVEALAKTTSHGFTADEAELRRALADHQLHWAYHQPGHVTCVATSATIEEFDIIAAELPAVLLPVRRVRWAARAVH